VGLVVTTVNEVTTRTKVVAGVVPDAMDRLSSSAIVALLLWFSSIFNVRTAYQ